MLGFIKPLKETAIKSLTFVSKINELADRVNLLTNVRGRNGAIVKFGPGGINISMKNPSAVKKAFCKSDASTGLSAICYLDVDLAEYKVSFTNGSHEPLLGETLAGGTSSETARVVRFVVDSGDWSTNDAVGTLYFSEKSGPFVSEALQDEDSNNICSIAIDFSISGQATPMEINVKFWVAGGNDISNAVPRLEDGDLIFVKRFADEWWCITTLQSTTNC